MTSAANALVALISGLFNLQQIHFLKNRTQLTLSSVFCVKSVLLFLALLVVSGCNLGKKDQELVLRGEIMGTSYTIKALNLQEHHDEKLIKETVYAILKQVDLSMSTYKKESELSRFNAAEVGQWIRVSEGLFSVMNMANTISLQTEGKFDATVGPLVNLWGFGPDRSKNVVPSEEKIKAASELVGFQHLEYDKDNMAVKKMKPVSVDLSAIAKGYAVDKVADYLISVGIDSFLVEVGGEVRAQGQKVDGNPWRIAIESPTVGIRSVQRIIDVAAVGVATSGDYRNYYEVDGERYSHTIDPNTGKPIDHKLASVTVVHPFTAMADGYATAFMVMGPEAALAFATAQKIPVFLIVHGEDGFEERLNSEFRSYLAR